MCYAKTPPHIGPLPAPLARWVQRFIASGWCAVRAPIIERHILHIHERGSAMATLTLTHNNQRGSKTVVGALQRRQTTARAPYETTPYDGKPCQSAFANRRDPQLSRPLESNTFCRRQTASD